MRKMTRAVSAAGAIALICGLSTPSAMAAEATDPGDTPAQVFEFNVTKPEVAEATTDKSQSSTDASSAAAAVCTFVQRVDYAHLSSSSSTRAVQSHGNWANVDCSYALADVTTQVDKANALGFHYAVGVKGEARLAPNPNGLTSGGAGRVTAHYDCDGTAQKSFRSWTDIDIVGYADATNKQYSPATDIACG
jgi:hypothetical protein